MLRGLTLSLTIVLALYAACSSAGVTRNDSADHLMEEEFTNAMLAPTVQRQTREISALLFAIKDQFRDIVQDIFNQAVQSIRSFMFQARERLLKTLDHYTFSDVLRVILNVFFEPLFEPEGFVGFEEPVAVETVEVEPVEVKPVEVKVYRNPYSLASLLNHH